MNLRSTGLCLALIFVQLVYSQPLFASCQPPSWITIHEYGADIAGDIASGQYEFVAPTHVNGDAVLSDPQWERTLPSHREPVLQLSGTCYFEASMTTLKHRLWHYTGRTDFSISRVYSFMANVLWRMEKAIDEPHFPRQLSELRQFRDPVDGGHFQDVLQSVGRFGVLLTKPQSHEGLVAENRTLMRFFVDLYQIINDFYARRLPLFNRETLKAELAQALRPLFLRYLQELVETSLATRPDLPLFSSVGSENHMAWPVQEAGVSPARLNLDLGVRVLGSRSASRYLVRRAESRRFRPDELFDQVMRAVDEHGAVYLSHRGVSLRQIHHETAVEYAAPQYGSDHLFEQLPVSTDESPHAIAVIGHRRHKSTGELELLVQDSGVGTVEKLDINDPRYDIFVSPLQPPNARFHSGVTPMSRHYFYHAVLTVEMFGAHCDALLYKRGSR